MNLGFGLLLSQSGFGGPLLMRNARSRLSQYPASADPSNLQRRRSEVQMAIDIIVEVVGRGLPPYRNRSRDWAQTESQ
jgi:hypothetical protein